MIILICSPCFIFKTHQKWDLWEQYGHFSFMTHHNTWNTNLSFPGTIMGWCFILLAAKGDEVITTCGRLPRCVRSAWQCRPHGLFLHNAAPDMDKKNHVKLNVWEFPVLWHYDGISVDKWCSPFAQQTVNPWVKWSILLLNFRRYQTPTLVTFEKRAWGDLPVMNTGAVSTVTHGPLLTSQVSLWPLPMVKSFGWSPKGSDYGFQQPKWGLSTGWTVRQRGERQSGGTPDLSSRSCAFRGAGWCCLGT